MELQHTHTFRVTMTRSHRNDMSSIRTNTTYVSNTLASSDLVTERDARRHLKKNTRNSHPVKKLDDTKSPAVALMEHTQ